MAASTQAISLGSPLSEQAIRDVNFFNGRLVTSRDMARTQEARREADARLGQGIGAGIVQGLELALDNAAQRQVRVSPGLAISASGQTLCLGAAQVLALVPAADAASTAVAPGNFGACGALSGGGYVVGNGLYLLTLAPLVVTEGKAPVLALEPGNARCNTDAIVEAVQFRLLRVDATLLAGIGLDPNPIGAAAISKWRSAVAYACFGFPGLQDAHPLIATAPAPGLLDSMRQQASLSECDVPLGLVYLTGSQGIAFIDAWAVRRRVAGEPASDAWSAWFGPQLDALGEAQLAQFQQQLADIPTASLTGLKAGDWLAWLPPAGFLDAAGARRLDGLAFLDGRKPAKTVPLAPGDVRALLSQALRRDAVKLDASGNTPRFRLYTVNNGGPQFFVREAPNAPHAEEVWLDGARARLPGVHDVQSAIDALRARVCGELSLWPGVDAQALIDALQPFADVHLCFEPGSYVFAQPLRLSGLGNVIIHGNGNGSLLQSLETESALIVYRCKSLTISEVALAGGRIGSGKSMLADGLTSGIQGALTVMDTPKVHIERVTASCLASGALGAACIVVRQTATASSASNTFRASGAVDEVGGVRLPAAGSLRFFAGLATPAPTQVCIADCELQVGPAQMGILCVDNDISDIRGNRIRSTLTTLPPERGIVVAGSQATEVSITHNSVTNAAQGIAIGLSRSDAPNSAPLLAQRAVVSRNTVQIALGERDLARNRFGIFVGNANSLLMEGNRVQTYSQLIGKVPLEGIRLSGVYGRYVSVLNNHVSGAQTGINFTPQGLNTQPFDVLRAVAPAISPIKALVATNFAVPAAPAPVEAASPTAPLTAPATATAAPAPVKAVHKIAAAPVPVPDESMKGKPCMWLFQGNLAEQAQYVIVSTPEAIRFVTPVDNLCIG